MTIGLANLFAKLCNSFGIHKYSEDCFVKNRHPMRIAKEKLSGNHSWTFVQIVRGHSCKKDNANVHVINP